MHQEVLHDRPSDSAGKKVSAPTITTVPTSSPTKSGPWVGNVPLRDRYLLLGRQAAGDREQRQ